MALNGGPSFDQGPPDTFREVGISFDFEVVANLTSQVGTVRIKGTGLDARALVDFLRGPVLDSIVSLVVEVEARQ